LEVRAEVSQGVRQTLHVPQNPFFFVDFLVGMIARPACGHEALRTYEAVVATLFILAPLSLVLLIRPFEHSVSF